MVLLILLTQQALVPFISKLIFTYLRPFTGHLKINVLDITRQKSISLKYTKCLTIALWSYSLHKETNTAYRLSMLQQNEKKGQNMSLQNNKVM